MCVVVVVKMHGFSSPPVQVQFDQHSLMITRTILTFDHLHRFNHTDKMQISLFTPHGFSVIDYNVFV